MGHNRMPDRVRTDPDNVGVIPVEGLPALLIGCCRSQFKADGAAFCEGFDRYGPRELPPAGFVEGAELLRLYFSERDIEVPELPDRSHNDFPTRRFVHHHEPFAALGDLVDSESLIFLIWNTSAHEVRHGTDVEQQTDPRDRRSVEVACRLPGDVRLGLHEDPVYLYVPRVGEL